MPSMTRMLENESELSTYLGDLSIITEELFVFKLK